MTTQHTPGPWEARMARTPSDGGWDWGIGANVGGHPVCIAEAFEVVRIKDRCPAEANARLIAAAPDLLDALDALRLQALQSSVNSPSNEWGLEALEKADAALKKARGK